MPPGQVWWVIDAKMPERERSRGKDMADVRQMVRQAKADEKKAA